MSERPVADAVRESLGADSLKRLNGLRRRLWWRRALRSALIVAAVSLIVVAVVQLVARALPFEYAPWVQLSVVGLGVLAWAVDAARRRPSLVEAARRADEELALRQRLGTALEIAARHTADPARGSPAGRRPITTRSGRHPPRLPATARAATAGCRGSRPRDDAGPRRVAESAGRRSSGSGEAARQAAEQVAERVEEVADELAEENRRESRPTARGARAGAT